jgi:hypothetical protein
MRKYGLLKKNNEDEEERPSSLYEDLNKKTDKKTKNSTEKWNI